MKTMRRLRLLLFVILLFVAPFLLASSPNTPHDTIVKLTLLHINDVYEITPVSGGKEGGLARVATVRKQLLAHNPNTFMILAGDLLSPSALGTAKVDGERLDGKQMVAVLNAVGLNYCTFGNHEFDLKEQPFLQRLAESRFSWFSSNVLDKKSMKPFSNVAEDVIFTVANASAQQIRVGLFGLTLVKNEKDYVHYIPPLKAAEKQVEILRNKADIIIAVTHLSLAEDLELAQRLPDIDLILGGHEHENIHVFRGSNFTPILKADANARSVYVHNLVYDTETHHLQIESQLQPITDKIPEDPEVNQLAQHWVDSGFTAFKKMGFDPEKLVVQARETLDGREATVRNTSGKLTEIILQGYLAAVPEAELAIFNGGSIRIDDELPPGPITEYDVIRILPFGGNVALVEMKGTLLKQVLEQGQANKGTGGYLHTANVKMDNDKWLINGKALDQRRNYKVAINSFLISDEQRDIKALNERNANLHVINAEVIEVRRSLINQLQETFGK